MEKKNALIAGLVVIVLIVVVTVALLNDSDDKDEDKTIDARYDWEVKSIGPTVQAVTGTQTADEGKEYVLLTVTVANDHYSDGIEISYPVIWTDWKLTAKGVTYETDFVTQWLPEYQNLTIQVGGQYSYDVTFQVPDGLTAEDISEVVPVFSGKVSYQRDTSL